MAQRAGEGADAARIAEAIGEIWDGIDVALAPVIGQRGVAALYRRSLHLAAAAHPWLELREDAQAPADLVALKSAISRQDHPAEATAGAVALLQAFQSVLTSLIGPSLTRRLLDAVWTPPSPSSGLPAQDPAP
ncbi:hypothetical protein [Luteimonas saliphila]|uniref:hypothetical protein n=1 Tax=Luteimonas saliphila TaxID=2804919 RepID=UPI00192D5A33|nr:hypothetical protein [Luteimonas saliphila]